MRRPYTISCARARAPERAAPWPAAPVGEPRVLGRHETSELEPGQLHPAVGADDHEPEVGEEVGREDGPVDEKPLMRRRPLRVSIAEGLDRLDVAVPRLTDRGEKQALHDPGRQGIDQIGTGHEHGVLGRRAGRQLERSGEVRCRRVLHDAEQAVALLAVQRPPRAPVVLDPLGPGRLRRRATGPRLPEDAVDADCRRAGERSASQRLETVRHKRTLGAGVRRARPGTAAGSRTSRLASGLAKKRNGTNVVPIPRETTSVVPGSSKTPSGYGGVEAAEAQLAAGIGQADLAVVGMPRENEVERSRREQVDDLREVDEQDSQVGSRDRRGRRRERSGSPGSARRSGPSVR